MTNDPDWNADLARVGNGSFFWREPSLWALWVYRYGRRIDRERAGRIRSLKTRWYWLLFHLVAIITGISIPKECAIGPGLRIWHFGGIFVHPKATIGSNCTFRQGVTIGNKGEQECAPTLGDNVELGAYAQIIGPVRVGSNSRIGALTAVVKDVPPGVTVVGQPFRFASHSLES
ncbi:MULTISPECIES: serine acetyltransferase [unclassified Bradyrhizobium]|uniref:serine acetyltransferase n=1 Tax=unclassified Bradyrhizobium TaxID=2631580 RepID=UPI001CD649A5|nr:MULTISPECIES: serine acetyltransferase [unclassified Bradyrhizobium]MCA1495216.1 serine acetyltransferase [Bradyrhizobium sp. NBAIM14]MCA1531024.1 serine acetyltransferase [Bradyrhizobium sp. NBAIM03]